MRAPHRAASLLAALALALALPVSWVALAPSPALAQGKGKPKGRPAKTAPVVDLAPLELKLRSHEPAQITDALAQAAALGSGATALVPAVGELLQAGASPAVARLAIETLGALGDPRGSASLRPYLRHRLPDLRRAAVRALTRTRGADAVEALREGLRSPDPGVRSYAASGLGNLGSPDALDALPDLFLSLDHNVTEAAAAIGQLCGPADCAKLVGRLGKVPFEAMTFGLDAILLRPVPLPEPFLLEVVGHVRDLRTPESFKYLTATQALWPASGPQRVKQALDAALTSTPGVAR